MIKENRRRGDELIHTYENRWNYTTKPDKRNFIIIMHIISLIAILQYFLYDKIAVFIVEIFYYIFWFFGADNWFINILYIYEPGETAYVFYNLINLLTAVTVSLIIGLLLKAFLYRFSPNKFSEPYIYEQHKRDKISYKFRLPKNTFALLVTGICIVQLSVILYSFFNAFLYDMFGIAQETIIDDYLPNSVFGIILYFVTLVITPAVVEEFIFRYMMLNSLKKYGNTFAIIVTSLLFGFTHARASAFIYATSAGLLLAYIAVKTKSMWFSMILHAVINSVAFGFQYLAAVPFEKAIYADIIYYLFLCSVSLISLIYMIVLIAKKTNLKLPESVNRIYITKKQKFVFFFNIATIIFFIVTIAKSASEYVFIDMIDMPDVNILKLLNLSGIF